jgi:uncharacterized SAM-binding protein YcdF (DUF218 family)
MPNQSRANREGRKLLVDASRADGRRKGGSSVKSGKQTPRVWWQDALIGAILGLLITIAGQQIGLQSVPILRGVHPLPFGAAIGAFLGISKIRAALWGAAGLVSVIILVVAYTPLVPPLIRSYVRKDALRPVQAVVVLSSDVQEDGEMTDAAQIRILRGYEVLQEGLAKELVITRLPRPKKSSLEAVQQQMRRLRMDFPIHETGDVRNTRDEALEVAYLAQKQGWDEVILVSDGSHLKRAGAAFEKAGLKVLCSPCPERYYDLRTLNEPDERLIAFREWLWEAIGYQVYKFRGWL